MLYLFPPSYMTLFAWNAQPARFCRFALLSPRPVQGCCLFIDRDGLLGHGLR